MRRSASRSPRMEGSAISFGSRESESGPRLVVMTDDGRAGRPRPRRDSPPLSSPRATQAGETRPASPAVLHAAPGQRCASGRGRRPAADRPRSREPRGRAAAARRRAPGRGRAGGSRPRLSAVPRASCAARGDRRAVPDALRRRAGPRHGSRRGSGTKTALVELAVVLAERESAVLLPDPGYPDYPSGCRAGRREARAAPARPGRRLGARAGTKPRARTSRPCTSTTRRIPAPPQLRPASSKLPSRSRRRPAPQSCTTSPTAI